MAHFKELDNNKIRIFVPANQYGGQNKFTTKTFDNPSKKEIEDFLTSSSVDKSIKEDVARLQAKRKGYAEGSKAEDPLIENVKNSLREKEGLRYEAYKPVPEEKHFTIGYGHYGSDVQEGQVIDEAQAEEYLDADVRIRVEEARKLIKPFDQFPLEAKSAIMDEFFRGSIRQSPQAVGLINQGRYAEAANEYLDNDEYRRAEELGKPGIRSRMERVAEALRSLGN